MTLTIHLTPSEEARLEAAAKQEGLGPAELARKLVIERLSHVEPGEEQDPTVALFARWDREGAAMTPEEIEEARREAEEFKQNINAERARASVRTMYP
jgi:hypothetical protein